MSTHSIIIIHPFAQDISGPDESIVTSLKYIDKQAFEFHLWLPKNSPYLSRYKELGVKTLETSIPAIRRNYNPLFWLKFIILNLWQCLHLWRYIKNHNIEAVHINMETVLFPALSAKIASIPVIYHVRGTSFYHPIWLGKILCKYIERLSEKIVCISGAVAELFDEQRNSQVITLYNPIADDFFDADTAVADQPLKEWCATFKTIIGSVGRINPRKNYEMIIRAAAQVIQQDGSCAFIIVGGCATTAEEMYYKKLKSMCRDLAIENQVYFTGAITNTKQLAATYALMDVSCLMSHSEGFGRVLAEAAAVGVPTIGANLGGIQEVIIENETGFLVPANDDKQLATAILKLLSNKEKLLRLADNAQKNAKSRFAGEMQVKKLQKIYTQVVGRVA